MARRSGQIVNRGERKWLVRWYVGEEVGRRRYASRTVHGTKRDAEKLLRSELRDRDLGVSVEPARLSLNAYLDRWLDTAARPKVTTQSLEGYRRVLNIYVRPALGGRRLDQLRTLDVQELVGDLERSGLAPRTVRMAHRVLSAALKQAVRWKMLATNPAADVDLPRSRPREMQALSRAEVERFRRAARGDRFGLLFDLALVTGMRPSEYLALAWSDVDLEAGTVTVRRSLARVRGGYELGETKTRRSRRTLPLPAALVEGLRAHRAAQAARALRLGAAYRRDLELVFPAENGEPMHHRNVLRRHFRPALRAAGLPESLRLYDLRHTCCTLALQAGVPVRVVAERLGHASPAMTLDVYAHVLPGDQADATERLAGAVLGDV